MEEWQYELSMLQSMLQRMALSTFKSQTCKADNNPN